MIEAYEDKLTITRTSIAYEYKPHPQSQLDTNVYRKWSYKTTNLVFQHLYEKNCSLVYGIVHTQPKNHVTDVGETKFIIIYEDKRKEERTFFLSGDSFAQCFSLIKEMIPPCEYVPAVLLTSDDYC